jgi:hypothetical protein
MSYDVHVPLGKPLQFPDICPFSGTPTPNSEVKLKRTSTSMILPIPGVGLLNSYSQTAFRIPACRQIAFLAVFLEIAMWCSLLGGFAVCVLMMNLVDDKPIAAVGPILSGVILSALCRIARFWVLRKVRIQNAWNGFVEVRFGSRAYATEFCEMNRLGFIE